MDEEYKPMMPAESRPKEVTPYSVTFGLIMAIVFSAAAAYFYTWLNNILYWSYTYRFARPSKFNFN